MHDGTDQNDKNNNLGIGNRMSWAGFVRSRIFVKVTKGTIQEKEKPKLTCKLKLSTMKKTALTWVGQPIFGVVTKQTRNKKRKRKKKNT